MRSYKPRSHSNNGKGPKKKGPLKTIATPKKAKKKGST